jgi:hypothetical protein
MQTPDGNASQLHSGNIRLEFRLSPGFMITRNVSYGFLWTRVKARYTTSTAALQVVEGEEKGTRCLAYNWATL